MARILSYPFRLGPDGSIATVEQGSDQANAEQVAVLILTREGERELCPTYGVDDPTFAELELGDVAAGLAMFGPDVDLESVQVTVPDEARQEVAVAFS